jgi:hypothetical protein
LSNLADLHAFIYRTVASVVAALAVRCSASAVSQDVLENNCANNSSIKCEQSIGFANVPRHKAKQMNWQGCMKIYTAKKIAKSIYLVLLRNYLVLNKYH